MAEAILMTQQYWLNSPLSIARHYGRCKINGHEYWIVNAQGKDLWQCTAEAIKRGNTKAIMPGEPADLVRKDFLMLYRKLGRQKFLKVLEHYQHESDKEIKERMKLAIEDLKPKKEKEKTNDLYVLVT